MRTANKKPDAIITADLHLRVSPPRCREDDYLEAQQAKMLFMRSVWEENGKPPFLVAGDVWDKWSNPPWILRQAIMCLPKFITISGQHDLPNHNLDKHHKSSLAVLAAAGVATVLGALDTLVCGKFNVTGFPWGISPASVKQDKKIKRVALAHMFTYKGQSPWPGCEHPTIDALLGEFGGFDLVVCGDNHVPGYHRDGEGRTILVPGSLMRTTAKQVDYEPALWLWYANTGELAKAPIPCERGVVSREHLDGAKRTERGISDFVKSLGEEYRCTVSFEDNMREFLGNNRVGKGVQKEISEAMGEK